MLWIGIPDYFINSRYLSVLILKLIISFLTLFTYVTSQSLERLLCNRRLHPHASGVRSPSPLLLLAVLNSNRIHVEVLDGRHCDIRPLLRVRNAKVPKQLEQGRVKELSQAVLELLVDHIFNVRGVLPTHIEGWCADSSVWWPCYATKDDLRIRFHAL